MEVVDGGLEWTETSYSTEPKKEKINQKKSKTHQRMKTSHSLKWKFNVSISIVEDRKIFNLNGIQISIF